MTEIAILVTSTMPQSRIDYLVRNYKARVFWQFTSEAGRGVRCVEPADLAMPAEREPA